MEITNKSIGTWDELLALALLYLSIMLDFMDEFVYGPTIEYIPCDLSRRCP